MYIFGWVALIALAAFGLFIIGLYIAPYVVAELRTFKYKMDVAIADRKLDIDRRSEARRNRDELKRQKECELQDKKLDAKLQKVDKQIELYKKKLDLSQELKAQTVAEVEKIQKDKNNKVEEEPINEEIIQEEIVSDDPVVISDEETNSED